MTYKLHTDGGSRGNPGPGAIGAVITNSTTQGDAVIYELSKYIGRCTNNEAEYLAVFYGLKAALDKNINELEVFVDSELVVKQLSGEYKVKNLRLKKIFDEVKKLQSSFTKLSFTHVKRNKNKRADELVNEALDQNGF